MAAVLFTIQYLYEKRPAPNTMLSTPRLFCGVAQRIREALGPLHIKAGCPHAPLSERALTNPRCSARGDKPFAFACCGRGAL